MEQDFTPAKNLLVTTPVENVDFSACRIVLGGNGFGPGTGQVFSVEYGYVMGEIAYVGETSVFIPHY